MVLHYSPGARHDCRRFLRHACRQRHRYRQIDSAWVYQLNRARDSLTGAFAVACYYRLVGFSSEGGWPGVLTDKYSPVPYHYDMYKAWPKTKLAVPPDRSAPSTPTQLSCTAMSPEQINLAWSRSSDDTQVLGYSIYRNGKFVQAVFDTTAINGSGIVPGTTYSFTIAAFDAAGNISAASAPLTITMPNAYNPYPVADGYVSEGEPDMNFGSVQKNLVKGSPGYERITYLKFDMSHTPPVSAAVLRLHVLELGNENKNTPVLAVYSLDDNSWDESTLTWNKRSLPVYRHANVTVSSAETLLVTITEPAKAARAAGKPLTLCIIDEARANRTVMIGSRETSGSQPVLTIIALPTSSVRTATVLSPISPQNVPQRVDILGRLLVNQTKRPFGKLPPTLQVVRGSVR